MWFWIFMMVMDCLVPVTMLYFGRKFTKNAPKEINTVFGYRTTMSMKSEDTWKFAHKYCGRLWTVCGAFLLPVSLIVMLFFMRKDILTVSITGGVVCTLQIVIMLCTLIPTEIALRRHFDQNGFRR